MNAARAIEHRPGRGASRLVPLSLGLGAALLVGASVYLFLSWHVPADRDRAIKSWNERLSAMADDRRFALDRWLSDGRGDARTIARYPTLRHMLGEDTGSMPFPREQGARAHLRELLTSGISEKSYRSAAAVAASGALVERVAEGPAVGDDAVLAAARRALQEREAVVDLWRSREVLALLFAAPVGVEGGPALGALVLEADPEAFLFRLLRSEPAPTATGEAMLARRESDSAVFIGPARLAASAPLELRRPLSNPQFAMQAALQGEERFGEFLDHRGVRVLAATRLLKTVPWGLVVKVDTDEALAPHRGRVRAQAQAGAVLGLALVGIVMAVWKWRNAVEEARIQGSRARTALLLDHANDVILFVGADGRIRETNRRAEEFYGLGRAELVGRPVSSLRASDERSLAAAQLERARSDSVRYETVHVRSDGSRVPVEVSARAAVLDEEMTIISVVRDVSERKAAEAALVESEARLRAFVENLPAGAAYCEGEALTLNPAAEKLTGYSKNEIATLQQWFTVLYGPEAATYRDRYEADRVAGFPRSRTVTITRKDASKRQVELAASATSEKGVAVWVMHDISALLGAEQALRESEARNRAIVETAVDAIVTIGEDGVVQSFNPAAERMFGYAAAEVLGRNVALLMPSPYREEHDGYLARYRATGEKRVIGLGREVVGRRKDGVEFPIDIAVAELHVGASRAFTGIVRDLTESKRLEQQFRQAQKMEAVGRLAGGVAHDFNNMLGVITGYSEIVLRKLEAHHPARAKIDEVLKAAERAAGLTRQLLAFSRRQVLEPKVVDLNLLLKDLQKMLHRLIGEDVELLFQPGAELGPVRVDPGQMEQVVMNLAVNARDAMPRGGRLTIATGEADVDELRAQAAWKIEPGRYVWLSVADTGVGMDEATRARVFEPFFTTKAESKGTGLGLATVYGIVKQSGGHILVESAPGHGARFSIYLPRVAEAVEGRPAAVPVESAQSGETVLLVEDQEAMREVTREMLSELGYRVLAAPDADAAVALAREHRGEIHLLLSDVVMPKVSGPELAARVVAMRPGIKVLFMSGYTSDVLAHHVVVSGVHLVEKPFNQSLLGRKLRRALSEPAGAGSRAAGVDGSAEGYSRR